VLATREAVRQICERHTHDAAAPARPQGNRGGGRGKGAGKWQGKTGEVGQVNRAAWPDWGAGWNARTDQGLGPPPLALATPQGDLAQREHFEGSSLADLVPTRAVQRWAATRLATGGPFTTNVSNPCEVPGWRTPRFAWYLWFAHERKLKHFIMHVAEIWLVVVMALGATRRLGFWFRLDDGTEYVVKFIGDGGVIVVDDPAALQTIDWQA
jgi:hypothetical protein